MFRLYKYDERKREIDGITKTAKVSKEIIEENIAYEYEIKDGKNISNLSELKPVEYVMYKRRWIGMFAICFLNLASVLAKLSFTSVPVISQNWLHTGLTEVNLSTILFFVGCIVISPISGYIFEKWGLKTGLLVGGLINCVGVSLRYFASFIESSDESYEFRLTVVYLGHFIAALAQPFFLIAPPKFAGVWFSESSRGLAVSIGTLSNPVATAVSVIVIPAICKDKSGEDMPEMLLIIAIVGLIAASSVMFMTKEPPTPPSTSPAILLTEATDDTFWMSLKKISSNTQFWILFTIFSIQNGIINAYGSLFNQVVKPYGYNDNEAGIFSACLIGAGLIAGLICGIILDKYKIYKPILKICNLSLSLGFVGIYFLVRKDGFVGIILICAYLGVFGLAILPVIFELGIESTYPTPPSTSSYLLWMGAQTFGTIFIAIGDALRDETGDPPNNMDYAVIAGAGLSCTTLILVYFFKSPYYRIEAETQKGHIENKPNTE